MPWAVRLTSGAEDDLTEIAAWTTEQFGARQAESYVAALLDGLRPLAAGPTALGTRSRPDIAPELRSLAVPRTRHVVIFRWQGQGQGRSIDVLRILDAAMDPSRHLGPDDPA
jgi:toxin ParE1/3/4